MAEDESGGVADQVESFVAVHIGDVNASSLLGVNGEWIDVNARARVAAGEGFVGAPPELVRTAVLVAVIGQQLFECD